MDGQGKEKITIPISWTGHNDANCNDKHDEYSDLPSSSKKHSCDITSNRVSNGKERNLLQKVGHSYGKFMFNRISNQQEIC
jgi:hypothetical protein